MLVTSIFFFSHNVLKSRKDKALVTLSFANTFNLDQAKFLSFGKGLKTKDSALYGFI